MKKKILLAIALVVLVLIGYVAGVTKKGAEDLVDVATDVSDMQSVVDSVNCIFVGVVKDSNTLIFDYDGKSEFKVQVAKNIKGELPTETTIYKHGGHFINGNEVVVKADDESYTPMPEVGKQYLFLAFEQESGEVIIADYYGNIDYTNNEKVSEILQYTNS
ncbi:MAG: hypothetical protein E7522_08845 [Ruminococcaceae bacterium]|nr:hypothetical protein [Oscillospiraceae bacterium]